MLRLVDGSVYEGEWRAGKKQGNGKITYHNRDVYEGMWRNGVREGKGRYVWGNGNVYNGLWKDDRMEGRKEMGRCDEEQRENNWGVGEWA